MRIIGDDVHQLNLSKYNLDKYTIISIEKFNISESVIIPNNIKVLEFDNCINVNFNINSFNNLEKIIIKNCLNVILPSNLTRLKQLYIYNNFDNYCSILDIPNYPNLQKLYLEKCINLKNIRITNLEELYIYKCNKIVSIPNNLQKLTIIESYKLNNLSYELTSLKYLYINSGQIIEDEKLINLNNQRIDYKHKIKKIKKELSKFSYSKDEIYGFLYGYINFIPETLINLEELHIYGTNINIIPNTLTNLRILVLNNSKINDIPTNINNLERLDIVHNKNILTLPISLPKLTNLYLINCVMLDNIHSYPNLQYLFVSNCNNITRIPILNNLKDFYMYNCDLIFNLPILENIKIITIENCDNFNIKHFINNYSELLNNRNINIYINGFYIYI